MTTFPFGPNCKQPLASGSNSLPISPTYRALSDIVRTRGFSVVFAIASRVPNGYSLARSLNGVGGGIFHKVNLVD